MKRMIALVMALAVLCAFGASAEGFFIDGRVAELGNRLEVRNCKENITLREEADTSSAALARIPLFGTVDYIADADNGFYLVCYEGKTGYALSKYLEVLDTFEGKDVDVTDKQRYNINLFLSNFTEAGFLWRSGCYDNSCVDYALLTDFAIDHCWFNRQSRLEWGEYFNDNNVRLPEDQIAPIVKKYFGFSIKPSHKLQYVDYKGGYYYWQETGGHTNDGFACLANIEQLSRTRYSVWFNIYGAGENWDNDVCYYVPREAAAKYPSTDSDMRGHAVIDVGDSGLGDRSDWSLERMTVNREW